MDLIIDSGATKTAWRAVHEDGSVTAFQTPGLSPTAKGKDELADIVGKALSMLDTENGNIAKVYFYGAGLVSEASSDVLRDLFAGWCPQVEMNFASDLMAAARALFGDGSGVVAILGTGSNSCLYSGGVIMENIRPGGYILGDEGGGVSIGKALLSDFIKGLLPSDIEKDFIGRYHLDYPEIVRRVYKDSGTSAFLASFAPFVIEHQDDEHMQNILRQSLESFVTRSLKRYPIAQTDLKVGVVGSVGCACRHLLVEIGQRYGLEFGNFLRTPVDALVEYHFKNRNLRYGI